MEIRDEEIIEIYKRRWDIEQGYKELREHFGFGKEENRIYEALIARITLLFFTYNIVSYINRISNEPKTIGGLFKDLECITASTNNIVHSMMKIVSPSVYSGEIVRTVVVDKALNNADEIETVKTNYQFQAIQEKIYSCQQVCWGVKIS
jgi:hypothetical protein